MYVRDADILGAVTLHSPIVRWRLPCYARSSCSCTKLMLSLSIVEVDDGMLIWIRQPLALGK